MIAPPKGANAAKTDFAPKRAEDARSKRLPVRTSSAGAKNGAHVGLRGANIDIANDIL